MEDSSRTSLSETEGDTRSTRSKVAYGIINALIWTNVKYFTDQEALARSDRTNGSETSKEELFIKVAVSM